MALRKVASPEDVAAQVVVLASDEISGHVTGQIVTVAGGMEGRPSSTTEEAPMSDSPAGRTRSTPTRRRSSRTTWKARCSPS